MPNHFIGQYVYPRDFKEQEPCHGREKSKLHYYKATLYVFLSEWVYVFLIKLFHYFQNLSILLKGGHNFIKKKSLKSTDKSDQFSISKIKYLKYASSPKGNVTVSE